MESNEGREISVLVQAPEWNEEVKEKWSNFKNWVKARGGKWQEGLGMHQIFFKPVEKGSSITTQIEVTVVHYDDRPDPDPPNNYRVEIAIGEHTFIYDIRRGHLGCMSKDRADRIAKKVKEAIGL
jgi:hypothetical protein